MRSKTAWHVKAGTTRCRIFGIYLRRIWSSGRPFFFYLLSLARKNRELRDDLQDLQARVAQMQANKERS
jgi:hypothetical protein